MAKKSEREKIVDELEAKLSALTVNFEAARSGLELAIDTARGDKSTASKRIRRPRAVPAPAVEKVGA